MNFYEFTFPKHADARGDLIPLEFNDDLPFVPKRVYILKNTPINEIRGAHCHHIEEEIFVCITGSVTAKIDPDGMGKKEILLDDATKAIYVGKKVWHEFDNFSKDAVLLALSSTHYLPGEKNYEYSYEEFLKLL